MKNIKIIGASTDMGESVNGTSLAAEHIINLLEKKYEYKIIKSDTEEKNNIEHINAFNTKLYDEVLDTLNNEMFPLILGGDHSLTIGSALASNTKYDNMGIIWFDAHGDFNTFETSPSGNIHGLPFAVCTGYEKKSLTPFLKGKTFNPKNACLVGASDIDMPDEYNNLRDAGVTIFTAEDIRREGRDNIYKKAFEIVTNNTNGVHISYDVDVIDPKFAPGVSVRTNNGISLEDAYRFIDFMIEHKNDIKSFDLVEFNPLLDKDKITENIVLNILNKYIDSID